MYVCMYVCLYILLGKVRTLLEWANGLPSKMLEWSGYLLGKGSHH